MQIALTQGLVARVSPQDWPLLSSHRWHAVRAGQTHYAARRAGTKTIYMHRQVLDVVNGDRSLFVDHIDHDGLNNTRENLRASDAKRNAQNRRYSRTFTGLLGVRRVGERWEAQIGIDGRLVFLGSFPCEREAGIAYASACRAIGREV